MFDGFRRAFLFRAGKVRPNKLLSESEKESRVKNPRWGF